MKNKEDDLTKNREMIGHINDLDAIIGEEQKRPASDRIFNGRAFLLMMRNFRSLLEEYKANYEKDYGLLRDKFFTKKETEVVIPADKAAGIEERKEKRELEVLKPDCTQEQYETELDELLDLETRKIQISKIKADDLVNVKDYAVAMALDFMVE